MLFELNYTSVTPAVAELVDRSAAAFRVKLH